MAVPLMVSVKIICDRVPSMGWLAILLEREQPPLISRAQRRTRLGTQKP
jgi:hypothetical protein